MNGGTQVYLATDCTEFNQSQVRPALHNLPLFAFTYNSISVHTLFTCVDHK